MEMGINEKSSSHSDDLNLNGLTLMDHIMPEEVLRIILSKVDVKYLPVCRSVCLKWKNIVDTDIWRHVFLPSVYQRLMKDRYIPFNVFYRLHLNNPFNRNLIKNPSGRGGYTNWNALMGIEDWTDTWSIENPPIGAPPVPKDEDNSDSCCFAAAFTWCSKEQIIDLENVGVLPFLMDILKPVIYISEWYVVSPDCSSVYSLRVALLNAHRRVLNHVHIVRCANKWQRNEWNKVEYKFIDYKEGVRYIRFFHSGTEKHVWNGPHGIKIAKTCVKLLV